MSEHKASVIFRYSDTTIAGECEFMYDASGRLAQAKVNGVVEMNYAYNPFGKQVALYIAGQVTVSLHDEAGHWLGDYDGAGRAIRQVVWLDRLPVAVLDGDVVRDIQADHLGMPRVVIDRATDKAIWHWRIIDDSFGNDAPIEDPDKDGTKYVFDMRFPGQRYDAVTGLYQNGWRDYDPSSGRYVQSDPIGLVGGISTYAYAGSNPYLRIDPKGLEQIVALDMQSFRWGSSGFRGTTGHAAHLIGEEDGVTGWDYYSKDGEVDGAQRYVHKHYDSIADLYRDYPGRYMEGEVFETTPEQDANSRRWASANFDTPYNGATNNCADLVYGALQAGGVPVNRPFIATPKGILGSIDRSGGLKSRPLNPTWYPGKYSYPKSAFNW